jgi:hypothetical protein
MGVQATQAAGGAGHAPLNAEHVEGDISRPHGLEQVRQRRRDRAVDALAGGRAVLPNGIDQISRAIDTIKNNPDSRRIIVTGWNPTEVDSVSLPPCHTLFQFFCEPLAGYEMLAYGTPKERLEYDEFGDNTPERYKRIKAWAIEKGRPTHRLSCQLYQRKPHCAFTA